MINYPWYQKLENHDFSLQQGDLISGCPVVVPPQNLMPDHEYSFEIQTFNVLIMSQSCDLENDKLDIVLVCPYMTFGYFISGLKEEQRSKKNIEKQFDNFRKGLQPNYHLLNKEEGIDDYLLVDFRYVYSVHISFLREYVKTISDRVRLLPPYREHLAQAFARFFMRVGLPQDIQPLY